MTRRGDDKAAREHAKAQLDAALPEILDRSLIDSPLVEARLVWYKPFGFFIGQVRDQGDETRFFWIIGGDLPSDSVHGRVAETARGAARHFAVKWQLDAAQIGDPQMRNRLGVNPERDWDAYAKELVSQAEHLYSVVADDSLW